MSKVTTFLWFDDQAEQAARFYVSLFPNSKLDDIGGFKDARPGATAKVTTVRFTLDGTPYIALNGGPHYKLTPAVSLFVECATQQEVDRTWEKLIAGGGQPSRCGWLVDRFGLSWQIVPGRLLELLQDKDPARAQRVASAMLEMSKIDLAGIERAAVGSQL
jgi:predicted 3-demethylubiquinone-9 3-methyltransferase (glyoxalase superfamily)